MAFRRSIDIGKQTVSIEQRPYIVAEVSANHNNDMGRALAIVRAAAESGADAVKFQTYTADTITLKSDKSDFVLGKGLWEGRTLHDLYQEGSLPWDWHQELFTFARSLGLGVISSPFDETAVDFLVDIGVEALKIASFELTHIPLIEHAAKTGLPIIMSTGMGTKSEVSEAVEAVRKYSDQLILLHCISSYPALPEDYSVRSISHLGDSHECLVGISDHCETNEIAVASVLLGSVFIEKHFTLDRNGGGLDDSFSQEPDGFRELRRTADSLHAAQRMVAECSESELASRQYRRSIYCSQDIQKGDTFSGQNIRVVRPGFGLHPRHYSELLGRTAVRDISYAEPITLDDLNDALL